MNDKLSEKIRASLDEDTLSFPVDEWADEVAAFEADNATQYEEIGQLKNEVSGLDSTANNLRRENATLEARLSKMEEAATDAILILGGFDPAKVAEDMGAVADKAMMDAEALAGEE